MKPTPRGFAMILVIWILILMTSLALGLSRAIKVDRHTSIFLVERVELLAASDAALRRAIFALQTPEPDLQWQANAKPHPMAWGDLRLEISITSASGRIDLNRAPEELLLGLIEQFLQAEDPTPSALVDALLDWRDPDHLRRVFGAEDADYQQAGLSYEAADAPFSTVSELILVQGFNERLVYELTPYLTVASKDPRIDPRAAFLPVLAAIPGVGIERAKDFIVQRDQALANDQDVDINLLGAERRYLSLGKRRKVVAIRSAVRQDSGPALRLETLVRLGGPGGYRIIDRRELPADQDQP